MQGCHFLFGTVPPVDSAAAQECLDVYRTKAQEATFCQDYGTVEEPEACKRAFPSAGQPAGTSQPGQSCGSQDDCAQGTSGDVFCSNGTCQLFRRTAEGQACSGTSVSGSTYLNGEQTGSDVAVCYRDEGLYCDSSGTCKKVASAGGACSGDISCVDGTYCGNGVCKAKVGVGQSCEESESACDDASYCAFPSNLCEDRKPIGEPCGVNSECETSYCQSSGVCAQVGADLALLMICP